MSESNTSLIFRIDAKDNFSQFKQSMISNTVSEIDNTSNTKDIVPQHNQDPKLDENDPRAFWDK